MAPQLKKVLPERRASRRYAVKLARYFSAGNQARRKKSFMALLKKEKVKPVIRSAHRSGVETSPLRPYLQPKQAPCMDACPQATEIRRALMLIAQSQKYERPQEEAFENAWRLLTEKNPIPAACGRVCPHPCEDACNRKDKDGALRINSVERFLGDWALERGLELSKSKNDAFPEKIAVVGSGPAGLSCAYQLARRGYAVTVFEAFPQAGGMLRYGIPSYRLPRRVLDAEIDRILRLGVQLQTNTAVGKDISYEQVRAEYDAVFIGIGAHQGVQLGCPGEDAANVMSGIEFLRLANSGKPVEIGKRVIVVGGGDTAIDAARVALRMGANATLLYRRTRNEMPAIEDEIVGAEEEGIGFCFLAAPIEIMTESGRAVAVRCQEMELGEPDESGRRRPVPIAGREFTLEADSIIAAVSQRPDFRGLDSLAEGGWAKADDRGAIGQDNVYTGGDDMTLGLVTIALYQGRRAAEAIHKRFRGLERETEPVLPIVRSDRIMLQWYQAAARHQAAKLETGERLTKPWEEFIFTLSESEAVEEAQRCMSCGSCFDCGSCWSYCQDQAVIKPITPGEPYRFKLEFCNGCNKCKENCPCGLIEMR
jgi:NADPH-dependent glutamate synthase beta subunit-like oxidoreductase